jgi:hypothetical protein
MTLVNVVDKLLNIISNYYLVYLLLNLLDVNSSLNEFSATGYGLENSFIYL